MVEACRDRQFRRRSRTPVGVRFCFGSFLAPRSGPFQNRSSVYPEMPEGLSMSVGDVAVYLVAFVALAILAFGVINGLIRNWRDILSALGVIAVIGAIGGVAFLLLGAVLYVGVLAYGQISDQRMMQQCSTAHERRGGGH